MTLKLLQMLTPRTLTQKKNDLRLEGLHDWNHRTRDRLLCHSATSAAGISLNAERGPPGRVRPPSDLVGEALLIFSVSLSPQVTSPVPPHALSTGKVRELAGASVLYV